MVGIVVALGKASGSEVWGIVQSASAQSTLVPCSNDDHTFFISVEESWIDPFRWKGVGHWFLNGLNSKCDGGLPCVDIRRLRQ